VSRLAMPPGEEPPARDLDAEKELARQIVAWLDQATRDLDRAADRLEKLEDLGRDARAAAEAAELVAAIAHSVRIATGTP
jgi:hypothetical protein